MQYRLFIICLVLSSCASSRMIETSLYFAQTRQDGSLISETDWKNFKKDHIQKVFKEGSSEFNVTGNWYDTAARKLITEPTHVVVFIYKPSRERSRQIDSLRNLYKIMFRQESILRVDKKVKAYF